MKKMLAGRKKKRVLIILKLIKKKHSGACVSKKSKLRYERRKKYLWGIKKAGVEEKYSQEDCIITWF